MTEEARSPTAPDPTLLAPELICRDAVKAILPELEMSDATADWVLWEMTSFPFGQRDEVLRMARACVERMRS